MKQLYFIRHGESELNARRILAGHIDTPLTARGRTQAEQAGQHAKQLAIDCVLSSPLQRAHETARIVAHELDIPADAILVNDLLVERAYGLLEGTPWDTANPIDDEPSVETLASVLSRARDAYAFVQTLPYDNILIASHGTFGLALRAVIEGEPTFHDVDELLNATIVRLI